MFFSSAILSNQPTEKLITIRCLNHEGIKRQANDISRMMKWHSRIQISMAIGALATQIMQMCRLGKIVFGNSSSAGSVAVAGKTKKDNIDPNKQGQSNFFVRSAKQLVCGVKGLLFNKEGWQFMLQELGIAVGGYVVNKKLVDPYWHSDTLRWFVHSKAPHKQVLDLIGEFVEKLGDEQLNEQQKQFYRASLMTMCDQLVGCAEQICAYIEHKGTQLSDKQRIMAVFIGQYLYNRTNHWSQEVAHMFNQKEPSYHHIRNYAELFVEELKRQIKYFASVEGELQDYRAQVT